MRRCIAISKLRNLVLPLPLEEPPKKVAQDLNLYTIRCIFAPHFLKMTAMKALVAISDKQFFVQPGDTIFVPKQKANAGETLTLENVLLTSDGTTASLSPKISVTAKVLRHLKGEKVIVFKKKRRKRYRRTYGHRQAFTELEIVSIA